MQRFPGMLVAAGALSVGGNPGVHAQSSEIVSTGFATISSTPAGATVALSLATLAQSAASAATHNAEKVRAVMAAIGERDGLVDSLRVTRIDVSPHRDHQTGKVLGYEALATIEVVVRDPGRVGEILDLGLPAGASSVSEARYRSDSLPTGRDRALALALAAANESAEILARAAGERLGSLVRRIPILGDQPDVRCGPPRAVP